MNLSEQLLIELNSINESKKVLMVYKYQDKRKNPMDFSGKMEVDSFLSMGVRGGFFKKGTPLEKAIDLYNSEPDGSYVELREFDLDNKTEKIIYPKK